ncbi:MAG: hypothetical protein JNJ78_24555 [Anaerolineae bacterium]|nr:hypothetical protein [Anaerolineae bacterium]
MGDAVGCPFQPELAALAAVSLAAECQLGVIRKRLLRPSPDPARGVGGGVAVKCGGKQAMLPPRGAFVVVVVGSADKEYGTPTRSLRSRASPKALGEAKYRRDCRRQWVFVRYAVVKLRGALHAETTLEPC